MLDFSPIITPLSENYHLASQPSNTRPIKGHRTMLPILITPLDQPVVARRRRGPSSYAGVVTSPPTLGSRTISSIIFAHAYSTLFRTRLFYSFFLHMPFLLFFLHTLFLLFFCTCPSSLIFAHIFSSLFLQTPFLVSSLHTFSSLLS